MRLFFLHVLGVRPECLHNRRKATRARTREWCTDGVAASSIALGIFGLILAFRGEIEAQGRGSLHPHVLAWLLGMSNHEVVALLRRDPGELQGRLRQWMRAVVAAVEATEQSSVHALPRQFGDDPAMVPAPLPLGFSATEQKLSRYDGGSELDDLRAEEELAPGAQRFLEVESDDSWRRPLLPLQRRADLNIY